MGAWQKSFTLLCRSPSFFSVTGPTFYDQFSNKHLSRIHPSEWKVESRQPWTGFRIWVHLGDPAVDTERLGCLHLLDSTGWSMVSFCAQVLHPYRSSLLVRWVQPLYSTCWLSCAHWTPFLLEWIEYIASLAIAVSGLLNRNIVACEE